MPASLSTIICNAVARLNAITETPRLDAEILLAHALNMPRARLLASLQDSIDTGNVEELISRRAAGEPIAYIIGEWEFFSREFLVEPPVLVPRPETEHLVEEVLKRAKERPRVLEIGTGTGCVAVTLACEHEEATVVATDVRAGNLDLAHRNALRHEVESRIHFVHSDLFEQVEGVFDIICSNPPYVAETDWDSLSPTIRNYEDRAALLAGPEGLDLIDQLISRSPERLKPNGSLIFEFGAGQRASIERMLADHGYRDLRFAKDLADIDRIAVARRPK